MELKIKEEFKNLIRPLTEEEYNLLEENIKTNGCHEPIVVLQDNTIIDGHNRYEICRKHSIEYKTFIQKGLETEEDVKLWMLYNQISKRNYTNFDKSIVAIEIEKLEKVKAKERQLANLKQFSDKSETAEISQSTVVPDLVQREGYSRSLKIAAKKVGIGYETARKTKKILESDDKALIERLKKEEISINGAFHHIDRERKRSLNNSVETKDYEISIKMLRTMRAEDMKRLFNTNFLKRYIQNKKLQYLLICKDKGSDMQNKLYSDSNISFEESCKLYEKYVASKEQEKSHLKGKKIHLD